MNWGKSTLTMARGSVAAEFSNRGIAASAITAQQQKTKIEIKARIDDFFRNRITIDSLHRSDF
jgi:hypothetical protein